MITTPSVAHDRCAGISVQSPYTVVSYHKEMKRTYLLLRPIPHNYAVPTVDEIFYDAAAHDTQTEESKFQG